ncbi:MAG: hypothetical protein ACLQU1_31300 [Bryobacteraceae bacterium]
MTPLAETPILASAPASPLQPVPASTQIAIAAVDPADNSPTGLAADAAQPPAAALPPANQEGQADKDQSTEELRTRKPEAQAAPPQPDGEAARWALAQPSQANRPAQSAAQATQPPAAPAKADPAPPEAAKPATLPARDIKLDLGAGEGRVEVRVVERGGEVRVAVHTSDERLAGDLREHLPSLSSRLEQSGLRAETWHAAAAGGERMRAIDSPSSTGSPSPGGQDHPQSRERQQDAPPRQPKLPAETSPDREKGNNFAWLMDSLG